MPTSTLPTPTRVLQLAEGLMKIGFPHDVDHAVATLRRVTADNPAVLEEALALARRQVQARRSMLLVVELLIQSLIEVDVREVSAARGNPFVAAEAN